MPIFKKNHIGSNVIINKNVIIGYPTTNILYGKKVTYKGTLIGNNAIVRSNSVHINDITTYVHKIGHF